MSVCPVVRPVVRPVMTQRRPEPRIFLAERPLREKLSHRAPHTILDALSEFELHRCLLRCGRECKGIRDVGPKFETHVPDLDPRGSFVLLILDQLSRKLDGICSIVKIC